MTYAKSGVMTLYFTGDMPLLHSKKIILNANQHAWVNNIAPLTNIAPEYAPYGKHLIATSHLGISQEPDETLYAKAMQDMARMFTNDTRALKALATYQPLAVYRIPYAQFTQPAGIFEQLPSNQTPLPNVFIAGELTGGSNLNAAMQSGESAAWAILAL
jgi:phytoene dehydrogenase-like protein